jgi:hypothetical protein
MITNEYAHIFEEKIDWSCNKTLKEILKHKYSFKKIGRSVETKRNQVLRQMKGSEISSQLKILGLEDDGTVVQRREALSCFVNNDDIEEDISDDDRSSLFSQSYSKVKESVMTPTRSFNRVNQVTPSTGNFVDSYLYSQSKVFDQVKVVMNEKEEMYNTDNFEMLKSLSNYVGVEKLKFVNKFVDVPSPNIGQHKYEDPYGIGEKKDNDFLPKSRQVSQNSFEKKHYGRSPNKILPTRQKFMFNSNVDEDISDHELHNKNLSTPPFRKILNVDSSDSDKLSSLTNKETNKKKMVDDGWVSSHKRNSELYVPIDKKKNDKKHFLDDENISVSISVSSPLKKQMVNLNDVSSKEYKKVRCLLHLIFLNDILLSNTLYIFPLQNMYSMMNFNANIEEKSDKTNNTKTLLKVKVTKCCKVWDDNLMKSKKCFCVSFQVTTGKNQMPLYWLHLDKVMNIMHLVNGDNVPPFLKHLYCKAIRNHPIEDNKAKMTNGFEVKQLITTVSVHEDDSVDEIVDDMITHVLGFLSCEPFYKAYENQVSNYEKLGPRVKENKMEYTDQLDKLFPEMSDSYSLNNFLLDEDIKEVMCSLFGNKLAKNVNKMSEENLHFLFEGGNPGSFNFGTIA